MRKPSTLKSDVGRELVHISNQNETKLRTKRPQKTRQGNINPQITTQPHRKHQLLYLKTRTHKTLPRLQIYLLKKIRKFVISDPPLSTDKEYQKYTVGDTNCCLAATDGNCSHWDSVYGRRQQ